MSGRATLSDNIIAFNIIKLHFLTLSECRTVVAQPKEPLINPHS